MTVPWTHPIPKLSLHYIILEAYTHKNLSKDQVYLQCLFVLCCHGTI